MKQVRHPRVASGRWPWALALVLLSSGCAVMQPDAHLVAFSTQMTGMNEMPPVRTAATGRVDAVLDSNTRLLRWKASFNALSGPPTGAHFHGPAAAGSNAGVALGWRGPLGNSYEGRATLTPQQAAELMAGRWYANVHTAAYPAGEIRGQMIVRH